MRIKRIGLSLLVAVLLAPSLVMSAEPFTLYVFCMIPSDHNQRTVQRGLCDEAAEAAGFDHGIIRPQQCVDIKCAACKPADARVYECAGVAPSKEPVLLP
jgi:hypothetical protein